MTTRPQNTDFSKWRYYSFSITYHGQVRKISVFTPAPLEYAIETAGKAADEELMRVDSSPRDEAFQKWTCRKTAGARELQRFFQAMARSYSVEAPFRDAISLAAPMAESPYFRGVLAGLLYYRNESSSLSDLFSRFPQAFSPTSIALLKQAEATGKPHQIFEQLAKRSEEQNALMSEIKAAMTYPAIVTFLVIISTLIMVFLVLPKVSASFQELSVDLPPPTLVLIWLSDLARNQPWLAAAPLIAFIVCWSKRADWLKTKAFERISVRLPVIGTVYRAHILANSLGTLATMYKFGIYPGESFRLAAEVAGHHEYRAYFLSIAGHLAVGDTVPTAFLKERYRIGTAGRILADEMRVASLTGEASDILENVAQAQTRTASTIAKNLPKAIEPLLLIIIGIGVLFIMSAVMLPNFAALKQVLQGVNR